MSLFPLRGRINALARGGAYRRERYKRAQGRDCRCRWYTQLIVQRAAASVPLCNKAIAPRSR